MSEFREDLIEIRAIESTEYGIKMECTIKKTAFIEMFSKYEFKNNMELLLAQRIVKELPIEELNKITKMIDLDSVAKIATIEMAKVTAGTNKYC